MPHETQTIVTAPNADEAKQIATALMPQMGYPNTRLCDLEGSKSKLIILDL